MERLKILWFNWRCWVNPAMGGAEVFTHEVAKRLVAFGHEVSLFTSQFPNCEKEEVIDGINIVRSGGWFSVYQQAKKFYSKRFRAEDFDIIIDEINTIPFFANKFVKNKEKVVALVHQLAREYWFYETPFPINYLGYHFLENRWLKQYVDIPTVTVSKSSRQDLVDLGFKNIFIVPEGLNFEPLNVVPTKSVKPTLIFSGRLKRTKRPDHAIKAFEIVHQKMPESELLVLGDGPYRSELEKIAGDGVRFFGYVNNNLRREMIQKSWVLINPGIREGWGLNVIEANALGVPCVAYSVPGLRDSIQDGGTGKLVEAGNIHSLADAVLQLLQCEGQRKAFSENALQYSKIFNWDKTAKEFMKIIND